jgi:hypothetical protein
MTARRNLIIDAILKWSHSDTFGLSEMKFTRSLSVALSAVILSARSLHL